MTLDATKAPTVVSATIPEAQLQGALLKAIGFDRLSPEQRELALAIARQYSLDPMLRHLVLVDGKPYITRDGLLHVAHKSNVFDGIDVERPVLDEDGKYWRTWATVYRKDMSRPFHYPGRYPATGGNAKYCEEMAIKVAEVMTLRRAFDVAAPVLEERWDGEFEDIEPVAPPPTVIERIAARAAAVEAPREVAPTEVEAPKATVEVVEQSIPTPTPEPTATPAVELSGPFTPQAPPTPPPAQGPSLAEFAVLVKDIKPEIIQRIARALFPELRKFGDLKPHQLQAILDEMAAEAADEQEELAQEPESPVDIPTETVTVEAENTSPPNGIKLCGLPSPYEDGKTCTMDAGHGGGHRAGVRTSW